MTIDLKKLFVDRIRDGIHEGSDSAISKMGKLIKTVSDCTED